MNDKEDKIRKLAYNFFEKRSGQSDHALDDWLKAEKKIRGIFWRTKFILKNYTWKYDLFVSIIGGIAASVVVSLLAWWFITRIDPNKIFLCLRYAYEYKYEKATQEDPVRRILENVPVFMSSGQNLWFAVVNTNINSIENCTLHLDVQDGLIIKSDNVWQVQLPNRKYTYMFHGVLNNGLAIATNPLSIEFQKKDKYKVTYSITAKNIKVKSGYFFIEYKE